MQDSMLISFLKKERATIALMDMLQHFHVLKFQERGFKKPEHELWISTYDVKVFCTEWVKMEREHKRREASKSNSGTRLD